MLPSSTPSSEIIISDKKGLTKSPFAWYNTYTIKKEVSKMDIVRVHNWHTDEVLVKTFEDPQTQMILNLFLTSLKQNMSATTMGKNVIKGA